MVLNIYVSLEGIDRNLISAARTSAAPAGRPSRKSLPLSLPGLLAGLLLCFVLAAGSYVTPLIPRPRATRCSAISSSTPSWTSSTGRSAAPCRSCFWCCSDCSVVYSRYMGLSQIFKGLSR